MNEKKVIKHLMMETIEESDKGIDMLDNIEDLDILSIKTRFKNIKYYARMIIEEE